MHTEAMRRLAVFFIAFSFYLVLFTQRVAAQWTCCDTTGYVSPQDYGLHCDACGNTLTKNAGDSCGTNANCKTCGGSRIYANSCSGGGGQINMCDLFKVTPAVTVNVGQTISGLQILVKQGAYSKITLTNPNATIATANPALWLSAGLPDLGQNYTTETKTFSVKGLKAGTVTMTANQYATYPGYEMLYCSKQMVVTVKAAPTPTPTPTPTSAPVCSCGPWANGACRSGGCANGSYPQTRTCTPAACALQTQCVSDPVCILTPPTPTPTPGPTCALSQLSVVPVSGNFNLTGQFDVKNISQTNATFDWKLDRWDAGADQTGSTTLVPGQTIRLGMGAICTKWQLDLFCGAQSTGAVVEAQNCPTPTPTPTPVPTATPLAVISSKIETDPSLTGGQPPQLVGGLLNPYCTSPSSGNGFSAGSVKATDLSGTTYTGSINSSGVYSVSKLPTATDAYCVKFTPTDPNIVCSCPVGCQYCGKSAPTTQDLKFYVTPIGSAWYQTVGGDVGAQTTSGVAVANPISSSCIVPFCNPYLSLPLGSDLTSVGALITTKGGIVNLSTGQVAPPPDSRSVKLTTPIACSENYNYFYRLYSMGLSPASDFANPGDALKPTAAPQNGLAYYYTGSLPLTINQPWTVSGTESIVIFVNGDLHINAPVTVAPGAFLSFIVSGNMEVSSSVGTTDHASTSNGQVQGVYIVNGSLHVLGAPAPNEKKFVAEGTFAACSGIKIDRDFIRADAGLDNNKYPGALFLYRPDFVQNTPDRMKSSSYVWREVTP